LVYFICQLYHVLFQQPDLEAMIACGEGNYLTAGHPLPGANVAQAAFSKID
jgi:hypothetical protein